VSAPGAQRDYGIADPDALRADAAASD